VRVLPETKTCPKKRKSHKKKYKKVKLKQSNIPGSKGCQKQSSERRPVGQRVEGKQSKGGLRIPSRFRRLEDLKEKNGKVRVYL